MEYLVGLSLALGVSLFGTLSGFDRDRVFYPTVALVVASYYDLFAVLGGSAHALGLEAAVTVGFVALAVIGFRTNLWLVVAALAGHGAFDLLHGHVIANPGTPPWWPMFCMTYDVTAAVYLAWLLSRSILPARTVRHRAPTSSGHPIRAHVQAELDTAARLATTDASRQFRNLERAHVLSQVSTREHVRVHWRMLVWGVNHRDWKEVVGQIPRILAALAKTAVGLVPTGNTGGTNVNPFKPMPIPTDLAAIIADAKSRPRRTLLPGLAGPRSSRPPAASSRTGAEADGGFG